VPQAVERGDDVAAAEALTDVDGQTLAGEQIQHGQRAEPAPIGQLISDEVDEPLSELFEHKKHDAHPDESQYSGPII